MCSILQFKTNKKLIYYVRTVTLVIINIVLHILYITGRIFGEFFFCMCITLLHTWSSRKGIYRNIPVTY